MSLDPTILKLGGSVITHKEKPFAADLKTIKRLAKEVSKSGKQNLVLIHGAGSFGHPLAKQYGLIGGYKDRMQTLGFSRTHQAVLTLNKLVVDALLQNNVPAVTVSPSSCIISKSGRIHTFNTEPISRLLKLQLTPVLHGDVVLDSDLGFTVLSGDQLAVALAIVLNAERIIMGIDVDGLYTADPKEYPSASFVSKCTLVELRRMQNKIEAGKGADVTGGMRGKIAELRQAAEKGIYIVLLNAAKPKNIYKVLNGERIIGTVISK